MPSTPAKPAPPARRGAERPGHARGAGPRTTGRPGRGSGSGGDHTPERVLALAGVAALLLVFVVSVSMIAGAGGGDDGERRPAAAAQRQEEATPTPTPTPSPSPTPVPLTAGERAERDAAVDIVASRGFEVTRLRDWDPRDTLRVLIGRTSTGAHMAFFFVNGDYIGNDSTETSGKLRVRRTGDLTTTLRYGTYEPGDRASKPTGGSVDVRFIWDGTSLSPEGELPDPAVRTPPAG